MANPETVPDLVPPTPPPLKQAKKPNPPQPARPDRGGGAVVGPRVDSTAGDEGIDHTGGDQIDTADAPGTARAPTKGPDKDLR